MRTMRSWTALVVFGMGVGSLTAVAAGPKAGAPKPGPAKPSEYQVMTVIANEGGSHPLSVQSDNKGPYVTKTVNRAVQVSSVINRNANGTDWSLTTYYTAKGGYVASDRSVFFDLREQVGWGSFATPDMDAASPGTTEYGRVSSFLQTRCSMNNIDMLTIPVGSTAICPGALRFLAPSGQWYRLAFQPANYPDVEPFKVTCDVADATGCKTWTITPSGTTLTGEDTNPKGLNKLLHVDSGGGVLAEGGDYLTSFAITVTR
jgi:hypothetical protein